MTKDYWKVEALVAHKSVCACDQSVWVWVCKRDRERVCVWERDGGCTSTS